MPLPRMIEMEYDKNKPCQNHEPNYEPNIMLCPLLRCDRKNSKGYNGENEKSNYKIHERTSAFFNSISRGPLGVYQLMLKVAPEVVAEVTQ